MELISRYTDTGPHNLIKCLSSDTFWLDRADYYTWMNNIYYYDNEEDLIYKITHLNESNEIILNRKKLLENHETNILSQWQDVWTELLSKIEANNTIPEK
jgi:hypothetical protein